MKTIRECKDMQQSFHRYGRDIKCQSASYVPSIAKPHQRISTAHHAKRQTHFCNCLKYQTINALNELRILKEKLRIWQRQLTKILKLLNRHLITISSTNLDCKKCTHMQKNVRGKSAGNLLHFFLLLLFVQP